MELNKRYNISVITGNNRHTYSLEVNQVFEECFFITINSHSYNSEIFRELDMPHDQVMDYIENIVKYKPEKGSFPFLKSLNDVELVLFTLLKDLSDAGKIVKSQIFNS